MNDFQILRDHAMASMIVDGINSAVIGVVLAMQVKNGTMTVEEVTAVVDVVIKKVVQQLTEGGLEISEGVQESLDFTRGALLTAVGKAE